MTKMELRNPVQQATKPGSIPHAAQKIGCSVPIVYRLIKDGKLRSYHIGRAHRVSEQAIADCIALLEQESAEERSGSRSHAVSLPPIGLRVKQDCVPLTG